MQQSDKISILETVAFVRGSAHIIRKFAQSKLDVFFSRAILAAENKPWFNTRRSFTATDGGGSEQ